jgi:hypothetical protein
MILQLWESEKNQMVEVAALVNGVVVMIVLFVSFVFDVLVVFVVVVAFVFALFETEHMIAFVVSIVAVVIVIVIVIAVLLSVADSAVIVVFDGGGSVIVEIFPSMIVLAVVAPEGLIAV